METVGNSLDIFGSALEIIACVQVFMQCRSVKIYLHLPGTIIARQKLFLRGTLANFCKSNKCIIFIVDYRSESKKSKFDITLNRNSPLTVKKSQNFAMT